MKRSIGGRVEALAVSEKRAERGVYAAESHGCNGVLQTFLPGARFCGLKAALLAALRLRWRAERGVYAAEGHGCNGAVQTSQTSLAGVRFCGLKAALPGALRTATRDQLRNSR